MQLIQQLEWRYAAKKLDPAKSVPARQSDAHPRSGPPGTDIKWIAAV